MTPMTFKEFFMEYMEMNNIPAHQLMLVEAVEKGLRKFPKGMKGNGKRVVQVYDRWHHMVPKIAEAECVGDYQCLCWSRSYRAKNPATQHLYYNSVHELLTVEVDVRKKEFHTYFCTECNRDVTSRVKASRGERHPPKRGK